MRAGILPCEVTGYRGFVMVFLLLLQEGKAFEMRHNNGNLWLVKWLKYYTWCETRGIWVKLRGTDPFCSLFSITIFRYLKDNKHTCLHLTGKHARIVVLIHCLFLEAHSFRVCSQLGLDNVLSKYPCIVFWPNGYCLYIIIIITTVIFLSLLLLLLLLFLVLLLLLLPLLSFLLLH